MDTGPAVVWAGPTCVYPITTPLSDASMMK
jgi:hypothetical protein